MSKQQLSTLYICEDVSQTDANTSKPTPSQSKDHHQHHQHTPSDSKQPPADNVRKDEFPVEEKLRAHITRLFCALVVIFYSASQIRTYGTLEGAIAAYPRTDYDPLCYGGIVDGVDYVVITGVEVEHDKLSYPMIVETHDRHVNWAGKKQPVGKLCIEGFTSNLERARECFTGDVAVCVHEVITHKLDTVEAVMRARWNGK
jgi:hypothetical protein